MNEYIVSAEQEGMRLDVFLTEQMEGSRSYIQSLIKGGHVIVGGKVGKANLRLTPNMVIQVEIPEPESVEVKPEDIPLDVLYEDHDIIIVNKARGMVVHPAVGNYSGTLVNALLFHCKDLSGINGEIRPGIVHRLDKDTSGILMFAKNEGIKNKWQNNWNKIVYKRGYLAIIEGKLNKKSGTIKNYLDESKTQMVYITNNKKGKLAITNYQVLKETRYNSLVEIFLDTGRKNQIRVHMQSLGHSIVGDKKYGATSNPIRRLGLHAHAFGFVHPKTKKKYEFKTDCPKEFYGR